MRRTETVRRSLRLAALVSALGVAPATEAVAQSSAEEDRAVLVEFQEATTDEHFEWTNSTNWSTEAPLGEWYGVTTNASGRVTGLSLPLNGLSGSIPGILGNLSALERLNLHGNYMSGSIPSTLGNLSNLKELHLDYIRSLSGESLSGPIPATLGDLSNLEVLQLNNNALSGSIPSSMGDLSNLRSLHLQSNALSGSIPGSLGNLSNLGTLILAGNALSGSIPSSLGNLSSLGALFLFDNGLSGPIPTEFSNLSDLAWLELSPGNEGLCAPNDAEFQAWLEGIASLVWTGPTCSGATGPTPKPPMAVQQAVNDAIGAATNGEGLRTGGAPVTVPLEALFTFPSAAAAVTYGGATFSVSSTAPGVVSVSTTDEGPGLVLTPGADAGTATVTVDARPEGESSVSPVASVMFEVEVHAAVPALPAAAAAFLALLLAAVGRRRATR